MQAAPARAFIALATQEGLFEAQRSRSLSEEELSARYSALTPGGEPTDADRLFAATDDAGQYAGGIWFRLQGLAATAMHISVTPDRRGTGLGRSILSVAAAELGTQGVQALTFHIHPWNEASMRLAEWFGAEHVYNVLTMPIQSGPTPSDVTAPAESPRS